VAAPIHYQSPVEDSGRWLGFRFRPDDIVISTRRKTGTTWMQMICALLIFQDPELPDSLWNLSPWLDNRAEPHDAVYAQLAEQGHRRFIKTHTPLDGLPVGPGVTYIVTARHPIDAFLSLCHHNEVIAPPDPPSGGFSPPPGPPPPGGPGPWPGGPPPEGPAGFGPPPGGHPPGSHPPGGPPPGGHPFGPPPPGSPPGSPSGNPPGSPPTGGPWPWPSGPPASLKPLDGPKSPEMLRDAVLAWIADDADPRGDLDSLPGFMAHISDAWARRGEPNVLLVHYDDLLADLTGQMRWLAGRLGIDVPEQAWPALNQAATFGHMRDRADQIVQIPPGATTDVASFFRRGTSGAGRELLNDEQLADYYARTARLAPPELLQWLHRSPS
jgi:aryl sulfotransferase